MKLGFKKRAKQSESVVQTVTSHKETARCYFRDMKGRQKLRGSCIHH